jgi:acetoin utilization protein AcuB
MFVQDIMQKQVVTVTPETELPDAIRLMRERGFRHLPVLDDDRLVGIVSDRDVKRAMASPALRPAERDTRADRVRMKEIMSRAVITTGPTCTVEEAARVMVAERISALPVTEGGRLVGIITETDVLALFVRALGAVTPSSRLDVMMGPDRSALADVVATIESTGAPLSSVMTLADRAGGREAIVRIATIDPRAAIRALEAKGYRVRTPARRDERCA